MVAEVPLLVVAHQPVGVVPVVGQPAPVDLAVREAAVEVAVVADQIRVLQVAAAVVRVGTAAPTVARVVED